MTKGLVELSTCFVSCLKVGSIYNFRHGVPIFSNDPVCYSVNFLDTLAVDVCFSMVTRPEHNDASNSNHHTNFKCNIPS